MTKPYRRLIEPLMSYSSEVLGEMTPTKYASVRLTYEIIREAISDLHGKDAKHRQSAKDYFNSVLFEQHCSSVGISIVTMMCIVNNPQQYITDMEYCSNDYVGEYESPCKL